LYDESHFVKLDDVAAKNQKLQQNGISEEVYWPSRGIFDCYARCFFEKTFGAQPEFSHLGSRHGSASGACRLGDHLWRLGTAAACVLASHRLCPDAA